VDAWDNDEQERTVAALLFDERTSRAGGDYVPSHACCSSSRVAGGCDAPGHPTPSEASVVFTSRIRHPSREAIRLSVAANCRLSAEAGCVRRRRRGLRPRVTASCRSRCWFARPDPGQRPSVRAVGDRRRRGRRGGAPLPAEPTLRAGHRPGVSLSRVYPQLAWPAPPGGGRRPPRALFALGLLRLARPPWSGASA
jgi:hypothetical protein